MYPKTHTETFRYETKTLQNDRVRFEEQKKALIAHPSQKDVYCDVVTFDDLTSSTVDSSDESDQKSKAVSGNVCTLHVRVRNLQLR